MEFDKRTLNFLIVIFIVILLFELIYVLSISDKKEMSSKKIVTKITDGDTIIIEGGETIRLLGIDCDEKGKSCYLHAKNYIEERLLGQEIFLEMETKDKDIYGRSLRYVFLNGTNINLEMVERGYCVARFHEESKYKSEIQKAEKYAIDNKIGCKWN